MIKVPLLLALIGHILCGISDCSKKGRLNLKNVNDPEKMSAMFENMPLSYPLTSMLFGTLVISIDVLSQNHTLF